MHVRPDYRKKSADLQGDFMTEFQGCTGPAMKIGMHIILCVHAVWLQTHPCLKGYLGESLALAFSFASVAGAPPFSYIVCMGCKIHSHVPCIHINLL